jgi:hypothetical protein
MFKMFVSTCPKEFGPTKGQGIRGAGKLNLEPPILVQNQNSWSKPELW